MASLIWIAIFFVVLLWSGINPKDQLTWLLEVLPAILGFALLALTRKSFPLTTLTYVLILIHCIVLMIGGNLPDETRVLSIALFDHVESLDYERAHLLAGGLLVFSFLLLIMLYGIDRRWQRRGLTS